MEDKILRAVFAKMERDMLDTEVYEDAFSCLRYMGDKAGRPPIEGVHSLMERVSKATALAGERKRYDVLSYFYELYRRSLFYAATHSLDDFARAIEFDQKPEKKFYAPRRHYLRPMIEGYQDILDGNLRLLTVSMPKRAGKSQCEILFTLLLSGRFPDKSSLMEGTGDDLIKSFYNGCLEYLDPKGEYNYYQIFPSARVVQTNADLKTINLNRPKRFPTIMCRSIDARQVGLSEATNALILDDCVEGREEAKNRERLDNKWEVITGDIMGRAIEGTPMVFTGTRYSIYDPIGRIQEFAQQKGWAWRAVEIPALDPLTDESNYEHIRDGQRVFTTAYFREQRELLSAEQFESEFQQQPFEAKGLLFNKQSLNYYLELPVDREPDAIIAVCDTAESGEDSTALVVGKIYGLDVYIDDVVFDNSTADVTKPECAACVVRNKASEITFESNNAGGYFARDVKKLCDDLGYRIGIRTKRTVTNKKTRMEFASDNIKKHFWFKHPSTYKRGSQYWAFMKEVTSYTRTGKVAHDDAPDALSLLENEIRWLGGGSVEPIKRVF